jgi:tetratricopeptide (TPR) repeat protein
MALLKPFAWMLLLTTLGGPVVQVQAQQLDIPNRRGSFTAGELALLPGYCKAIQGTPGYLGASGAHWRSVMGDDLKHMHHYCRGLRDAMFATMAVTTPVQRRFLWERAVNEYDYIIRHSRPTLTIMPEVFTRQGQAYMQLNSFENADAAFSRARGIRPDYVPAYLPWIDKLIELKLYARAKDLVDEGLRHAPDAAELRERQARLGGRASPAAKSQAKETPSESSPAAAQPESKPEQPSAEPVRVPE